MSYTHNFTLVEFGNEGIPEAPPFNQCNLLNAAQASIHQTFSDRTCSDQQYLYKNNDCKLSIRSNVEAGSKNTFAFTLASFGT